MASINIQNIDKAALLAALWQRAKTQGMSAWHTQAFNSTLPIETVERDIAECVAAKKRLYFDYYCGRVIKTDISGDTLDPWLYDRDNGAGAAAQVVAALRV